MRPDPEAGEFAVTVAERVRPRDVVLFAITVALLAAAPWMMISAGTEPVEYRDANGLESRAPAWLGVLVPLVPLLCWSGFKAHHLLRRPTAAAVGPEGVRLYSEGIAGGYMRLEEPDVDLPWEEVDRVVVWRLRVKLLWLIPAWESRVGVEKTTDWYGVTQREPTERQRRSRGARRDGSPVRLGAMLHSRSVRLSPRGAVRIATAAARFAPRVKVVDERVFGRSDRISPKSSRGRTVY
jgi:hypothetical protein